MKSHSIDNKEANSVSQFKSIFYTAKRFEEKLDLNDDLSKTERRDWTFHRGAEEINFNQTQHQIIGYYIDIKPYDNNERSFLRFSTIVRDELGLEHLVDTADFHSTAMGVHEFNANRIKKTNDNLIEKRSLCVCKVSIGSKGFKKSEIAFLNSNIEQAYINANDLKMITKTADYIVISGAQVVIESRKEIDENGELKKTDEGRYFTWEIKGVQIPESSDISFIQNQSTPIIDKFLAPLDSIKNINVLKMDLDALDNINYIDSPVSQTLLYVESSSLSDREPPNGSFASPCPPRWDYGL